MNTSYSNLILKYKNTCEKERNPITKVYLTAEQYAALLNESTIGMHLNLSQEKITIFGLEIVIVEDLC